MSLDDEIMKSSNIKDNAFNIVLGFNGSIFPDKAKAVLTDFEELFMKGFSNEEYHLDALLHQDVKNHYIHIPKNILFKNTEKNRDKSLLIFKKARS